MTPERSWEEVWDGFVGHFEEVAAIRARNQLEETARNATDPKTRQEATAQLGQRLQEDQVPYRHVQRFWREETIQVTQANMASILLIKVYLDYLVRLPPDQLLHAEAQLGKINTFAIELNAQIRGLKPEWQAAFQEFLKQYKGMTYFVREGNIERARQYLQPLSDSLKECQSLSQKLITSLSQAKATASPIVQAVANTERIAVTSGAAATSATTRPAIQIAENNLIKIRAAARSPAAAQVGQSIRVFSGQAGALVSGLDPKITRALEGVGAILAAGATFIMGYYLTQSQK